MEALTTVDVTQSRNFTVRAGALTSLSWGYSEWHNYTLLTSSASTFPKIKGIYFKGKSRNTFWLRDCSAQQYEKEMIIQLMFSHVCKETYKATSPQQWSERRKTSIPSMTLSVKIALSLPHHFQTSFSWWMSFFWKGVDSSWMNLKLQRADLVFSSLCSPSATASKPEFAACYEVFRSS